MVFQKMLISLILVFGSSALLGQNVIHGKVLLEGEPMQGVAIEVLGSKVGATSEADGTFEIVLPTSGTYSVKASFIGCQPQTKNVESGSGVVVFNLVEVKTSLDEVVISGTMKAVSRTESPVPVEVYNAAFFKQNPTPNLFEGLQNINGVRPQLNCNVCNTGDIHINGLEGPYTMILIDGMPVVSGLSTVYGLSGIPNSIIERLEVVKGPASSLYGSEAVGGLINVITKNPEDAPIFSAEAMTTSYLEHSVDVAFKNKVGKQVNVLTGISFYNYNNPVDLNGENFTDVTLQDKVSIFQKWDFGKEGRVFTVGGRYFYENRWGGEMQWQPEDRGGDEVYGESILTNRIEAFAKYQLPFDEPIFVDVSFNSHDQSSYYGDMPYMANQKVGYAQIYWNKVVGRHDVLSGITSRYTYYDDNTPATSLDNNNNPSEVVLPGFFVQDEVALNEKHKLLTGMRYDYHPDHGNIFTPRLGYKWSINQKNILRLNAGSGFRVVNLFTEEHATLTGARDVVVEEELKPERSYNVNLNYLKKMVFRSGAFVTLDASAWYTYFTNQILPDYDTDPNQIVYDNLDGNSVSRGVSLNADVALPKGWDARLGASFIDVSVTEKSELGENVTYRPVLTERWTATWALGYKITAINLKVDYTGNLYGPMRLPLLGELDPRDEYSPWWSIQNVQLTWSKLGSRWEFYGGVKNLLNFRPADNSIARAHDPFDRNVSFSDQQGNVVVGAQNLVAGREYEVVPSTGNPYALTFDPSYVYAPNQGIKGFLGVRYQFY